jgi:type II secretory pathway component PulK
MKHQRRGIALILVMLSLAVAGLVLIVVTESFRMSVYQYRQNTLNVHTRNIHESALAWAQENATTLRQMQAGEQIDLEMSDLKIREASCRVTIQDTQVAPLTISVSSSCSHRRHAMRRTEAYVIEAYD